MLSEPLRGEASHFFKRSRFFKKVSGARNNDELFGATQLTSRSLVQIDHQLIVPPNDQQRRRLNRWEICSSQVWTATARNYGADRLRIPGCGDQRGAGARTGPEITQA